MLITAQIIAGLILLACGGEALVRGASRLAAYFGVSPLVIGLTVVAFGTSAPEMAVSVRASLSGSAEIALGNVIGSNIFNVLFILGACSLAAPLVVNLQLMRVEIPVMTAVSLLLWAAAWNGGIGRVAGAAFFCMLFFHCLVIFRYWDRNKCCNSSRGFETSGCYKN